MPTALSDPSQNLYVVLVIIVAVLAGLWLRSRKRKDLVVLLLGAGTLAAIFIIDQLVESPREETTRKIEEMAKASQEKKWDDLFKHVSESFKYKNPGGTEIDKKAFREKVKSAEGIPEYKGFAVWDFHRADFRPIDDKNVQVGFRAQLRDMPQTQSWIIATFAKEADGQWRMTGFTRYEWGKQDRAPALGIEGLN